MAGSEQVFQLSGTEDVHAVRNLVARADASRVLLVVPGDHPAFANQVRLTMIAREAQRKGIDLALVTGDRGVRERAAQTNLSTFRSAEAAMKAKRWHVPLVAPVPVKSLAAQNGAANGYNGLSGASARVARRERRIALATRSPWTDSIVLGGLLFGLMVVLSSMVILFVPNARITLVPDQVPLQAVAPVTIEPGLQFVEVNEMLVPAEVRTIPVQGIVEVATSGRTDVPSAFATGTVLFVNVAGEPVDIAAGTIVTTSAGARIRFRTTEPVAVPGEIGVRVTAPIEATTPGPVGNVRPLQINIIEGPAAGVVRVLNETGTEGGDVMQMAVVTAADQEQLRDQLRQRLLQEGRAALEQSMEREGAQERFLVPGTVTLEVTAETFNGSVGEQMDVLQLDLRARVAGLIVSGADVERIARRALLNRVPDGYTLLDEQRLIIEPGEANRAEGGRFVMEVVARSAAGADLSGEQIRNLVRGKEIEEARAALVRELPLEAQPTITVAPEWWHRMPYLPLRIFIQIARPESADQVQPEPSGSAD
jgi:hypothetical protein